MVFSEILFLFSPPLIGLLLVLILGFLGGGGDSAFLVCLGFFGGVFFISCYVLFLFCFERETIKLYE